MPIVFNNALPAAPTGAQNVTWQFDGTNASGYVYASTGAFGGDLAASGPAAQTVVGLEGKPLDPATIGSPADGQVVTYVAAAGKYKAVAPSAGFTAGGDLSGGPASQTVVGLRGVALDPSLASPTNGETLVYSGSLGRWAAGGIYDIAFGIPGVPGPGAVVGQRSVGRAVVLPPNFSGAVGYCQVSPLSPATFTVWRVHSGVAAQVGTATVSVVGAFTFASTGGSSVPLAVGDTQVLVSPTVQDAAMSNISITLTGTR